MDQSAFEMALNGDGFQEILTVRFQPGHDVGDHAHPYDVGALILEGEFTIVTDGGPRT